MRVTASKLREDIYRLLDQVATTGAPLEVVRKGKLLRIVPETPVPKLSRLTKRKAFKGNSDDIIHMNWLREWSELK